MCGRDVPDFRMKLIFLLSHVREMSYISVPVPLPLSTYLFFLFLFCFL